MKLYTSLFIYTAFLLTHIICHADNNNTDTLKKEVSVSPFFSDDIVAAKLDELALSVLFNGKNFYGDTLTLNKYHFKAEDIPQYTDEQYKDFMKKMDANSPFPFVYNEDVRKYIDLYAQKRRALTSRLLGLAAYYFPIFEEKLDKYNLPLELKYLAVIESALNPVAVSRAGAAGLWQFMFNTGKLYGLEVSSYVDDRYDPYKATTAACEHFIDLYKIYNDWALVLAAYNAGAGNVNRAIRKAGGEMDYWKIRKFMPRETQSYVPVYIAASLVLSHAAEHNIYPVYPGYLFTKTDTITVKEKIDFKQIAQSINIPEDELIALNPCFKKNVIPATPEKTYQVVLPFNKIGEFLSNEEEIYKFKTLEQLIQEDYAARNNVKTIYSAEHIVKKGESLGVISKKYNCTVNEIMKWNKLKNTNIHPGQRLVVGDVQAAVSLPKPPLHTTKEYYTVCSNETLREVAEKYNCTVDNLRLWNNIKNLNITQGQQLVIHIPVLEPVKETNIVEELANIENHKEEDQNSFDLKAEDISNIAPDTVKTVDLIKPANKQEEPKYIYHVVQKGDTLWNIAQRYSSVTVDDIKKLNKLTNNNLKLGQKLKLPVKDKS